jgi:hypothetical protein
MEGASAAAEKAKKDLEACEALLREKEGEIARKNDEIARTNAEMTQKTADFAAELSGIATLKKQCADSAAKALAHDSVVEENKAIMAHAVSLDAKIRELEAKAAKASKNSTARFVDAAVHKRLREELDTERIRCSTFAESVSGDKRQLAEQVSLLLLRVQTLEAEGREAKRQRALLEGDLERARI